MAQTATALGAKTVIGIAWNPDKLKEHSIMVAITQSAPLKKTIRLLLKSGGTIASPRASTTQDGRFLRLPARRQAGNQPSTSLPLSAS